MRHLLFYALMVLWCSAALSDSSAGDVPSLVYRSALAEYVPYREAGLIDWRAANDLVQRLGGHMGHARTPAEGERGREAKDRFSPAEPSGDQR